MTLPPIINHSMIERSRKIRSNMIGISCAVTLACVNSHVKMQKGCMKGSKNIERERLPVEKVFCNLGPRNICKSYRMH